MEILPTVKVEFYITGDEFDVYDVYNKMQIESADIRERKDFPIEVFAVTEWSIGTGKEYCKVASRQLEKIIKVLKGKEKIINTICAQYDATAGFVIVINMESEDEPDMLLPKEVMSFMASINAEFGFDIYMD